MKTSSYQAFVCTSLALCFSLNGEETKGTPSGITSETSIKRYVGRPDFKEFDTTKAFTFIAFMGEYTSWDPVDGQEVHKKPAKDFQTEKDALVFIREKTTTETGSGTIVGNAGVGPCIVETGKKAFSFLELLPAGYSHQFTVTRTWNSKLGNFNSTYHRRVCLEVGGKGLIANSIYYCVAVPWD